MTELAGPTFSYFQSRWLQSYAVWDVWWPIPVTTGSQCMKTLDYLDCFSQGRDARHTVKPTFCTLNHPMVSSSPANHSMFVPLAIQVSTWWLHRGIPCCRTASVLPPWNSRCKIELIFGVMLQFNVVWCIHSCREIVLTIQSDNGKQGYKVGGKKYRRPKVVLSQMPLRMV